MTLNPTRLKRLIILLCLTFSVGAYSQTTIDYEDFESGWGLWNDGGNDCERLTDGELYGNDYVRIRDDKNGTNDDSSMTTDDIDLTPYTSVDFTFVFRAESMEDDEDFWVQYSDDGGSSWSDIAIYIADTNFDNGTEYNPTISIDTGSYNFETDSQFRIRCDASNNNDHVYIDNILIEGYSTLEPDIDVIGNTNSIADGQVASATYDSDFGQEVTSSGSGINTFTIENTGNDVLNISSINLTGSSDFTLTSSITSIAAGASQDFTIEFEPTTDGMHTGTVVITSDDPDEASITFYIVGEGVAVSYCNSTPITGSYYITDVDVSGENDDISNLTNSTPSGGYSDYSATDSADFLPGSTYSFSISRSQIYWNYLRVWIDFNADGDFDDTNEEVYTSGTFNFDGTLNFNVTVPSTATIGATRMRISNRQTSISDLNPPTSCETSFTGEVEDYTINIISDKKIDFDGTDDYVDFGDNHDFSGAISFEAWILQENVVTNGTIISKGDLESSDSKSYGYFFSIQNGYPNFTSYNNGGNVKIDLTSPYDISNNIWYHLAVTYDESTAILYIDGVEVDRITTSGTPGDRSESCYIGAAYDSDLSDPDNYFNGFIDEVRIWDVALTDTQIREMMNQEIEDSGSVIGKVVPKEISEGLLWEDLIGYYNMNNDEATDSSDSGIDGTSVNITTSQEQTAPLPYYTDQDGDWDGTTTNPWAYESNWTIPNDIGIDDATDIDWNIVRTLHDVTSGDRDITVLGLLVDANELSIDADHFLRVTNYLSIDGVVDLDGESQLLQDEDSWLEETCTGYIERDQQGISNSFAYNYWSSPVSKIGSGGNNIAFNIDEILKDGTDPDNPGDIDFGEDTGYYHADDSYSGDLRIASAWIWKFVKETNAYANWEFLGANSSTLNVTEGFTMKGSNGAGGLTNTQNYVFVGKPNNIPNGQTELVHTTFANQGGEIPKNTMTGNPFPSAIDAEEFFNDNLLSIDQTLYFWQHWSDNTHQWQQYQGGYAVYKPGGSGVPAVIPSHEFVSSGGTPRSKPGRYIPVGQGFYVISSDAGGDVIFKNSQRVFQIETGNSDSEFTKGSKTKKTTSTNEPMRIRLGFDSPDGYHRQVLATFFDGATDAIDSRYDGKAGDFLVNDAFFIQEDQYFVIQAFGEFREDREIPISIFIDENNNGGIQKFSLDALENVPDKLNVYIKDNQNNGETFEITNSTFEIQLESGEHKDRFSLVFQSKSATLSEGEVIKDGVSIFMNNSLNSIIINNTAALDFEQVTLFNSLGQQIKVWNKALNNREIQLNAEGLSTGVYIVNLKTKQGTISKKILIE